jgi:hypothetical protein
LRSETSLTGVALSGDVEVVRLVLREPLEPVEQEHVSVFGCMFVRDRELESQQKSRNKFAVTILFEDI